MDESKKNENASRDEEDSQAGIWKLIGLAGGLVLAFVLYGVIVRWLYGPWADAGTFGDSFGVITGLVTGIALVLAFLSIHMQSRELRLQRRELELQRQELKESREVMELQREEMEKSSKAQRLLAQATGMAALVGFYTDLGRHSAIEHKPHGKKALEWAEIIEKELLPNLVRLSEGRQDDND